MAIRHRTATALTTAFAAALLLDACSPDTTPAPTSSVSTRGSPCANADALADAHYLDEAEAAYLALLKATPPASAPPAECAKAGLEKVKRLRGEPSAASTRADAWDTFWSAWIDPVTRLALPFLALLLALLVIVRLATRFIPDRAVATRGAHWRAAAVGGYAALVLLAAAMIVVPTVVGGAGGAIAVGALAVGALLAMVHTARYAAARLSLRVDVRGPDGKSDDAAASYVVARLQGLGSERPDGILIPQGTDVTELPADALATLPQGKLWTALVRSIQGLLPVVPWRATVSILDDDRATVILVRNGRLFDSTDVARSRLGLGPRADEDGDKALIAKDGSKPAEPSTAAEAELLVAAAAFLLCSLAKKETALSRGLWGARRWESIAAQVLATEPPHSLDDDAAGRLMATAVDLDPDNASARYTRLIIQGGRKASDLDDQRRFADAMRDENRVVSGCGAGYEALQLRILFSWASSCRNVVLLADDPATREFYSWLSRIASWLLVQRVRQLGTKPGSEPTKIEAFVEQMKAPAAYLWLGADLGFEPDVEKWAAGGPMSLRAVYDRACFVAEKWPMEGSADDVLRDLDVAMGLPDLREWAPDDPSFERLRSHAGFKRLVGTPAPAQFLALKPLVAKKDELTELGAITAGRVAELTRTWVHRRRLAAALGVSGVTVSVWRDVAELALMHADLNEPGMLELLLSQGIGSPSALLARAGNGAAAELAATLGEAARTRQVRPPTDEEVQSWVR